MTTTPVLEPNYLVYLAPGANADVVSPSWVDVSDDLKAIEITRGSPSDLDQNNPATLTFVLDNYAGTWDNENASSPYAGNLVTETQVMVLAEFDGELYPRFRGTLDDIQLDYPGEGAAIATFTATDGFKSLAQTDLPSSAYLAEVLADNPITLYRLNESDGSTVVYDMIGGRTLDVFGSPDLDQPGLVSREPGGAAKLITGGSQSIYRQTSVPLDSPPITLEVVHQRTDAASEAALFGFYTDAGPGGFYITTTGGTLIVVAVNGAVVPNSSLIVSTGVNLDDLLTHHIVATWDSGAGALNVYVDGVNRTLTPTNYTPATFPDLAHLFVGGVPGFVESPDTGTYQFAAIYNTVLSSTRIAAHAAAVTTPWNGDTPGARATRIADLADWPVELRNFDTGSSVLQSATLDMPAIEHLQKVADSEFGALFIALDGTLTLRGRTSLINRDPFATFGNAAGEITYRTISFDNSNTLLRNPVTVSRLEGIAQTAEDAANKTRFRAHQFTMDGLYHNSDALSMSAAEFYVSEFKDPKRRITGLGFGPAQHDKIFDLYPLVLTAELGDVYDVIFRAPNVAVPFEQTVRLEGTAESWTADGGHAVSWFLSPAYIGDADGFWQLGVRGHSELGLTTRLYF